MIPERADVIEVVQQQRLPVPPVFASTAEARCHLRERLAAPFCSFT